MSVNPWIVKRLPVRLIWPTVAREIGLGETSVCSVRKTMLGIEVVLRLTPLTTFAELEREAGRIAVAFSAARVRVRPSEDRANRATVSIDFKRSIGNVAIPDFHDPIGIPLPALRPFELGLDDDGYPVSGTFYGHHILVGGIPGSGKSNALRVFLTHLAASRDVALFGIDPKRVELNLWKGRFSHLVLGNEAGPTIDLLEDLHTEITRRTEQLSNHGLASLHPTREFPWVVLVIDEWAEVAASGSSKERSRADELLRRYVSLGRAVGCTAILCTQRPTSDVIDVGTRSLLNDRFALRCGDKYQAEAILSAGTFQSEDVLRAPVGKALWSDGGPARPLQFYEVPDLLVPNLVCSGYTWPYPETPIA